jgi:hypothetical protein
MAKNSIVQASTATNNIGDRTAHCEAPRFAGKAMQAISVEVVKEGDLDRWAVLTFTTDTQGKMRTYPEEEYYSTEDIQDALSHAKRLLGVSECFWVRLNKVYKREQVLKEANELGLLRPKEEMTIPKVDITTILENYVNSHSAAELLMHMSELCERKANGAIDMGARELCDEWMKVSAKLSMIGQEAALL